MNDELDRAGVRERLAELKRRERVKRDIQAALNTPDSWFDFNNAISTVRDIEQLRPLPEGGEGAPLDPWGRGPGSPFYSPFPRPKPDDEIQRRWDAAWNGEEYPT